jgi:hypothetical protein
MDRRSVLALLAAVTISCDAFPCLAAQCTDGASRDNSLWVEKVLERMQSIKPGMTRKHLLTVFTPEGGLSEVDKRTYRSQECLYFAVDVKFQLGDRNRNRNEPTISFENPQDRILTISPPYLKLSFVAD